MRVAIFGGTGYVGSHLVDALSQAGMHPVLLVRPGHESRVDRHLACDLVIGDLGNPEAIDQVLSGADAAIYNVGILREFPKRDITFRELQQDAACRVMRAAERAGVTRFLLMSANGVKPDGTPYQASKFAAERFLAGTGMDWTVFRPSVIFGDPRGRNEFATQLARDIVSSPLPAPLFYGGLLPWDAGGFALSPVHVEDVAAAFVKALTTPETFGQTLPLGGPRSLSWRQILTEIATAVGRHKLMVPIPAMGLSAVAAVLDRFETFPVTRDQLQMLLEGNTCGDAAFTLLGMEPRPFGAEQLRYLTDSQTGIGTCRKNAA
jgi:NADH dehydrogenase